MQLIRVKMLKSQDRLEAGQFYNLPRITALYLIGQGIAEDAAPRKIGPTEMKPAAPSEIKEVVKKKPRNAQTIKEF